GVGDIDGIRSRLGYLQALGVDVLWLSPIYRSPQRDNGYYISDYQDIDPRFGTLADFDALVADVHARGMKLVMDLVVNHTSDQHAWFQESRSSLDNPKRDWYWWRKPKNGAEPNGFRSAFSGPAWTLDPATGEYYLHLFAPEQPDLNWENLEVREAVYTMMRWWLDRGVDGFRMDVINLIAKRPELIDGDEVGDAFAMGPQIHEYLQEMRREVFEGRDGDFLTVGEMPGVNFEDAALFTDASRLELDMVFQFEHVSLDHGPSSKFDNTELELRALKKSLASWQLALADAGWNSLYLGNHDQPRSLSRFGDDGRYRYESATLLATLLHLHRGTPYIYQGDEIGMSNANFATIEDYRDIESLNHYSEAVEGGANPVDVLEALRFRSRDNARTPVQWDSSPNAGFSTGEPWIAVNPNYRTVNAAADQASSRSIYHYYQRLINLRHELPVVALGDFALLADDHPHLYAFTRSLDGTELLVLGNVGMEPLVVNPVADLGIDASRPGGWGILLVGNYPGGEALSAASGAQPGGYDIHRSAQMDAVTLQPWEVRVYQREVG
ncbi:MAG: alpha amylase catalytic region, partial [Glaciihabitans sp.]|nr:alpha amylase catalytic region [Glaciihabitans sp.]